jgi:hypothetical protein
MAKKKTLDVDTLWRIERVGAPSLSPDGAQAVAAVTRYTRWTTTAPAARCGCCPRWAASRAR